MIRRLVEKLRNRWLLRNAYESAALRAHFAARRQVGGGLSSHGCFDPWRVPRRTRVG